ncbi:MAG: metallophosphoesterase family protein [Acidimicrobiales bacterium]
MIVHRRRPGLWVFGVDQHAAQLTWRRLRPGVLRLQVAEADVLVQVEVEVGDGPGAVVLEGLPAGRLLTIVADGPALGHEPIRLLARTLPALEGEELCRIATISDLHLGTRSFGHRGTIREQPGHADPHPLRCAEAAVDEALAWGAERLVAKGDLTNLGEPAQWRAYAGLVHRAGIPVDAVPGNHDHGREGAVGSLLPREAAAAFGLSIATPLLVRDLPGLRVVLADTTREARHGGTLAPVADDIVDAAADADRGGGVLVVLHHQLHPPAGLEGWPPGIAHAEAAAFLDRLGAAHPHALVTSGHTHRHRRWGRAGVVVTQVGATKDYPGVWAGYVVHEGGIRQIVRRIQEPSCIAWTDHTRIAAYGLWEHAAPGRLDARCFALPWSRPPPDRLTPP